MKITVIGAGYVGLVSAACFSDFGFDVTCVDRDTDRVESLKAGIMPIYEPGLDTLVNANQAAGRLQFITDLPAAVADADIVLIAVGTPTRRGDDAADLGFVHQAADEIGRALNGYTVIVTKSTVPVGTAREISAILKNVKPDGQFDVASNPEFLREGSAVDDFLFPDRVVVGVESSRARQILEQLYRPLSARDVPVVFTNFETSELIKYASNTYLATRLGFVNQLADLCESVGADITMVARGMGLDKRIGQQYLQPGPGFGGSCFPKDTRAMTVIARNAGAPFTLVEDVIRSNERRIGGLADRVRRAVGGDVAGKRIGILGVSFKAETDDVRDSAALVLIPALQNLGATIGAYDPAAMKAGAAVFSDVAWRDSPQAVAKDADALVILTEWNEFRGLDLNGIAELMRTPVLIDFRNLYTADDLANTPLAYHSVGRRPILPDLKVAQQSRGKG